MCWQTKGGEEESYDAFMTVMIGWPDGKIYELRSVFMFFLFAVSMVLVFLYLLFHS